MTKTLERVETKNRKEGPMKKPGAAHRTNVTFPESMKDRLDEIMMETDKGSLSEVFRDALRFYVLAFEEHKKNTVLQLKHENGEVERLRLFL